MGKLKDDLKVNSGVITLFTLVIYRFGNWVYYQMNIPIIKHLLWAVYKILDLIFVRLLMNAELPAQTKIGKGLYLPHGCNGIIINSKSIIGDNVTIFHQVTIGVNPIDVGTDIYGPPIIGNRVFIGAGAKIIGNIKIGDYSKIGANAVVLSDVPQKSISVGIPAKTLVDKKHRDDVIYY
ncbi:serine acetyltransferase [Priestia megaterium]|uniref:serine O-acetyltransferase n=1 Tax=Priestia megaterium TaxID=1404 RepID=UPI000BFC36A4|nr:serine acetyltransferase [Priestia megaterium]PGN53936.1 serine acetyltransferase [Priestia megaterium]